MRIFVSSIAAILAMSAAPAMAEPAAVPDALADPALAGQLGRMADALGEAVLELPVGGIKAAAEGRTATPAERGQTVRDLGRRDDPGFEARLRAQIAASRPMIAGAQKALVAALPKMIESMDAARKELERAATNIPRPDYPKR